MNRKAAIYHFTDKSIRRPKIYRDQLDALEEYATSVGFVVADVYCDTSLRRYERTEFDRFLSCCGQYDALITKDYYHISKNTGKCISIMQELRNKGLKILTPVNGVFIWEDSPLKDPLKVATYTCHLGDGEQVQMMKLLDNKDKYDLLLVHDLNDMHWRTANFCKIREILGKDIYSLKEGFLKYRKSLCTMPPQ